MALYPISSSSRSSFGTSTRAAPVGVLSPEAKSLVLLTAGDITVKTLSGPDLVFVGLPAGYVIPFVVSEIVALGSGATAATIDG
jgi:hypothetical protein